MARRWSNRGIQWSLIASASVVFLIADDDTSRISGNGSLASLNQHHHRIKQGNPQVFSYEELAIDAKTGYRQHQSRTACRHIHSHQMHVRGRIIQNDQASCLDDECLMYTRQHRRGLPVNMDDIFTHDVFHRGNIILILMTLEWWFGRIERRV